MKKIRIFLMVLAFTILLPATVKADCESDFKEIEDKFKVTYAYNYDTDDFTITLVNPDYKKYSYGFTSKEAMDASKPTINDKDGSITHTISGYKESTYIYIITGIYEGCKGKIKQETIELKKDNRFAYSPLCEGYEEFVLCQKDYDKEIDEETFKERLEVYKKTKAEQEKKNSSGNNKANNGIVKYIEEHLVNVIIAAVVIIALVACSIIFIKTYTKRRRLE